MMATKVDKVSQSGGSSNRTKASSGISKQRKASEDDNDNVVLGKEAFQDVVQDELDRTRQKLAKNAMRIIELEQQSRRLTGKEGDRAPQRAAAAATSGASGDEEGISDDEALAFQMGFNSIEYATGSGTVTVSRQGSKTILTVDSAIEEDKQGWLKTLANFIKNPKVKTNSQKLDGMRQPVVQAPTVPPVSPEDRNKVQQKAQVQVPIERLTDVERVWCAWYGNPQKAWQNALDGNPLTLPPPGRDVTAQVNANLRIEDGKRYLLVKRPLNTEFGDPAFGFSKVLLVNYTTSSGINVTAKFSETPEADTRKDVRDFANLQAPGEKGVQSLFEKLAEGNNSVKKEVLAVAGQENVPDPFPKNSWWMTVPWWGNGTQTTEVTTQPNEGKSTAGDIGDTSPVGDMGGGWKEKEKRPVSSSKSSSSKSEKKYKFDKKAPPVIPFVKYASPGPPTSEWTSEDCNAPAFRILSLDGGGVRGVLSTVILQRIVAECPTFMDNVDLIAGTSTGGLIGLMLAAGYSPSECQDIYEYGCPRIFEKDKWRVFNPTNAKYTAQGREDLCRTYLGDDRTLKDLNKHVVITAFRLDGKVGNMGAFITRNGGWRPAVFSNIPKLQGDLEPDLNLYAWDAALRTSAAPTYFPVHRGYVDGAMFQNNPSMLAVTKACAHFPRVSPENCVVLSLGAGNFPMCIPQAAVEDLDWGIKDWVPYIFDLMLDGDSLSSEVLMRYMLGGRAGEKRYHRIDPPLSKYTDLDDVDVIPELIELGRTIDLNETIKFVQSHFSSTPTASDAFAQAAVRTAGWAREQAAKVQLSDVVRSLTAAPQELNVPWMGTSLFDTSMFPGFPGFPGSDSNPESTRTVSRSSNESQESASKQVEGQKESDKTEENSQTSE